MYQKTDSLVDKSQDQNHAEYKSGQCENCLKNFETEQIKWSEITNRFMCDTCIETSKENQLKDDWYYESKTKIKKVSDLIEKLKSLKQDEDILIDSSYFDGVLPIWSCKYSESNKAVILELEESDYDDIHGN